MATFLLYRRRPARLFISFDLSEYQVNARLRKTPRGEQGGSSKPTGGNCRHHSIASPIHPLAISSSGWSNGLGGSFELPLRVS